MTEAYLLDVTPLEEERLFAARLEEASPFRRQLVLEKKNRLDAVRSLGVTVLLDAWLATRNLREKEMTYGVGEKGKPFFAGDVGFCFNASHSGRYALAVFSDQEVGCDVEELRARSAALARRWFVGEELDYVLAAGTGSAEELREPSQETLRRFVRTWTIKEAYLKWRGTGLAGGLASFEARGLAGGAVTVKEAGQKKSPEITEWVIPGALACVCASERVESLRVLRPEGDRFLVETETVGFEPTCP